ncbi:MAG: hypothetical protein ACD_4C00086G0004 [uncultured bacterium (gcode 4)]|uniref:Uncharacterized protein n=1 Tax=uncultured bacterium (gcode 4) TaxID=1234023 RepID=K2FVN2_9BACT|nr:MAG: hypothetical protein ACD_4C00086G0004 [uncultured bacterium (gcode 4)]
MKEEDFKEEDVDELSIEESLEDLEEEEIEEFSWHRLDTFSEVKNHDWTYSYDEEYFEKK